MSRKRKRKSPLISFITKLILIINLWLILWMTLWHFAFSRYSGDSLYSVLTDNTDNTDSTQSSSYDITSASHRTLIPNNQNPNKKQTNKTFLKSQIKKQKKIAKLIDDLIRNITILESNPIYRVGNILLHDGDKWKQDLNTIRHNSSWNHTILHKYLDILNYKYSNLTRRKFHRAIDWYLEQNKDSNIYYPSHNEFVMHLRLGDVVDKIWFLQQNFELIISRMIAKYSEISKITFLTAMHFGGYVESRSFYYNATAEFENKARLRKVFQRIINRFGTEGQIKSYSLVSNKNTDLDMIAAVRAKYLYTNRCKSTFAKVLSSLNYEGYKRMYVSMKDERKALCYNKWNDHPYWVARKEKHLKRKRHTNKKRKTKIKIKNETHVFEV